MAIDDIGPACRVKAIIPDDEHKSGCRAIYVGTGGDITLIAIDDDEPTLFKNVPSGYRLDVACKSVMATGTTATDLVALN